MATFTSSLDQVEALYVGYFGRAGDPAGTNYWIGQLNAGTISLAEVAGAFAVQPEAQTKYPYLATPNLADPGAFVDLVYQNLFNHAADAAGKAYWVAQLQAASGNPQAVGQFILNVISGATGTDEAAIRNKVEVARDFTTTAANLNAPWTVTTQAQSSAEIAAVNDQPESVAAAKAATVIYFSTVNPGPPLDFTLLRDSLESNANGANFNAPLLFNAGTGTMLQSLQTGDSALYTGANGILFATLNGGADTPDVTLRGIQTATVTSLVGGSGFSGNITGIATLNNNGSIGSLTLGLAGRGLNTALSTVNISASGVGAGANTQAFIAAQALAGMSDAISVNITGALGTSTVGIGAAQVVLVNDGATGTTGMPMNAYETQTINSTNATFLQLSDAATGVLSTSTLILTGAGALQLSAGGSSDFSNLTKIDASATTGGVTITGLTDAVSASSFLNAGAAGLLTGNTVLNSFKGGSGADRLDISNMTAAQVQAFAAGNLEGGMGRDTLVLGAAALNTETALAATGFEIVGTGDGFAGAIDVSKLGAGVDTLRLFGYPIDVVTITNVPTAFSLDFNGFAGNGEFTINGPGASSDVLNLSGDYDLIQTLSTQDFEVVNFKASTPVEIFDFRVVATVGSTATVNIVLDSVLDCGCNPDFLVDLFDVGSGTVNVSGKSGGGVGFVSIAATALNGSALNVGADPTDIGLNMEFGAVSAIRILGSDASDALVGSPEADVIDGGAGDDFLRNSLDGSTATGDVLIGGNGQDLFSLVGDAVSSPLAALYGNVVAVTDLRVDSTRSLTDIVILSGSPVDYPNISGSLQAQVSDQGDLPVQGIGSSGTQTILNADNEIVKLTQTVSTAGLTLQAAFDSAIGGATITDATLGGAYFFMMYDLTNSKMVLGVVDTSGNTDGVIEAGDDVFIIGSADMSAAAYANVGTNQFMVL